MVEELQRLGLRPDDAGLPEGVDDGGVDSGVGAAPALLHRL